MTHVRTIQKIFRISLLASVAWGLAGHAVLAADCQLQLLNGVPMRIENDVLTVPADVNGTTHSFQLDTAAIANQMTEASARAMGLPVEIYNGPTEISGSGSAAAVANSGLMGAENNISARPMLEIYNSRGLLFKSIATAKAFDLGVMQGKDVDFQITDLPPAGVDGVINIQMFRRFDLDLDFVDRKFNTFSQDHCRGQVLYWRAPGVTKLPILTRDNRIVTRVTLDGKELTAIIDTGSRTSALSFAAATRLFDMHPDAATAPGGNGVRFKTLSFGTVAFGNPQLVLTPGILVRGANPNPRTGSRVQSDAADAQPDMLIGMDLLKLLHLYVALGERSLYVTQGAELGESARDVQPVVKVVPFRP
jgi:hypothetical protein